MRIHNIATIAVIFAVALTPACRSTNRSAEATREAPVAVGVETVASRPIADRYEAVGTIASKTTSVLSSQVMGRVTAVRVKEGDRVKAGQVLVELDARDVTARSAGAQAGVAEAGQALVEVDRGIDAAKQGVVAAEANVRLARVTFERYRKLFEARSVSPQEFDEVESRYKVASAELERARTNVDMLQAKRQQVLSRIDQARAGATSSTVMLDYARIVAPFAAKVARKSVEPGTMAMPGVPLLTLENDGAFQLEASVEESLAGRVAVGESVAVRIDALGAAEVTGVVAEVAPSSDSASRSVIVKIALEPLDGLRSGLFGTAFFAAGERTGISVPTTAVVERGQLTAVFVLDGDSTARLRFVSVGRRVAQRVEVLSGLTEGERVAVSNVAELADGRAVTVQSAN